VISPLDFDLDPARAAFEQAYGDTPTHFVRAPGRVNLIGEHIDYCGLSVLPAALEHAVWVVFRSTMRGEVRIATTIPGCESARFPIECPIAADPPGAWGNYPRAAIQALAEAGLLGIEAGSRKVDGGPDSGFDALVDTNLPIASGVSSSSALVVATALAGLHTMSRPDAPGSWGNEAARLLLAEVLARGERYVGTEGGGMDQAACLLGAANSAIRVDFDPLRAMPIAVPPDWRFIIADSGQRAEKSGAAQGIYNDRTEQMRAAAKWAWTELGEPERFFAAPDRGLKSVRELAERPEVLDLANAAGAPIFSNRLRHVLSEAKRVDGALAALGAHDLNGFGALLFESHSSLRHDYEVSTPRLDALVAAAKAAGAAGARLTGAGLGGCIVAVCQSRHCDRVLAALEGGRPFVATFVDGATVSAF